VKPGTPREGRATIPEGFLIDPQALAAVVPDCYAEFRPAVADGLTFFLRHLTPARLAGIVRAQADLPAGADLPRRLVVFLHACPALHKLGQVLARHRGLDPELRRHLQELESLEPHTPAGQLRPILARELAPAAERYRIRLGDTALAEGSVAVVVPLTWSDPAGGGDGPPRQGVAKILKPGVVERLDEDLYILGLLAGYLDERWAAYGLPPLAYGEILAEVADLLIHEVRLGQEQANLRRAADQFRGQSDVRVPGLLPFCTDALTAMDYVAGVKVTDPEAASPWRRPALFRSAVRALVGGVLFSLDEAVLFHGDAHAGNLLATPDGRLAILDWSLSGQLTADDRAHLARILVGGWALDAGRVATGVAGLVGDDLNTELIRRHVEAALAGLPWSRLPGPGWVLELLDDLARAGLRFPPRLLLFRKAYLTLQGVLADLCPGCSLEASLMAEALARLAWEWPLRWWKPLGDRAYGTHVSTADLIDLALRGPAAWAGAWPHPGLTPADGS
jgi:ubiquinone biosynthesis protein